MKYNKITPIVPHIAGWLVFFSLMFGFLHRIPEIDRPDRIIFSWAFIAFCLIYLFLFYFNSYVLIPVLYLRKKFAVYAAVILLLFAAVYFIKPFDDLMRQFVRSNSVAMRSPPMSVEPGPAGPPPGEPRPRQTDIVSIILFLTVWSLSTAICIIRQWRQTERRAIQAEAAKANAELLFLKAQLHPHFLFNTLNNIYSMVLTKNENAADSIMKLSDIMRYITDEAKEDFVPLKGELVCMKNYLSLQQLRLGKKTTFSIDCVLPESLDGKKIAPFILVNFLENAFKYGISNHEPAAITVKLKVYNNQLHFFCQNRLFETKGMHERTGVGLANTKDRLQYLYPGRHNLEINTENGYFTVQLSLDV